METPRKRGRPRKVDLNSDVSQETVSSDSLPKYELSVSIGDFNVNLETDDIVGAILDIKPAKLNQKVVISIRQGERFISRSIFPIKARMLFGKKMYAQFFVKRLLLSMK